MNPRLISGERIAFTTRKHWAALIIDSAWAIAMVVGSFVLTWVEPDATTGLLGFFSRVIELIRLGLFFGGCGWIIYNVIAWRTAEYSVTNRRVLGQEGLLRRRSADMLLSSLSDIRTISPAIGRVLDYGHIRLISAAGETGQNTFTAVHQAEAFKRQVLEQKEGSTPARPGSAAPTATDSALEAAEVLAKLTQLRDVGALSADEYDEKRAEWLRRI